MATAPLRGSDRRKLKQRVVSEFNVSNEVGDLLIPEGIQSQKFSTHLNEPGVSDTLHHASSPMLRFYRMYH